MHPRFEASVFDIGHPCYGQLTPVKTIIPWPTTVLQRAYTTKKIAQYKFVILWWNAHIRTRLIYYLFYTDRTPLLYFAILSRFFKLLGLEERFQKTPFSRRVSLVGVGLASEIKLRFQISLTLWGLGLRYSFCDSKTNKYVSLICAPTCCIILT